MTDWQRMDVGQTHELISASILYALVTCSCWLWLFHWRIYFPIFSSLSLPPGNTCIVYFSLYACTGKPLHRWIYVQCKPGGDCNTTPVCSWVLVVGYSNMQYFVITVHVWPGTVGLHVVDCHWCIMWAAKCTISELLLSVRLLRRRENVLSFDVMRRGSVRNLDTRRRHYAYSCVSCLSAASALVSVTILYPPYQTYLVMLMSHYSKQFWKIVIMFCTLIYQKTSINTIILGNAYITKPSSLKQLT